MEFAFFVNTLKNQACRSLTDSSPPLITPVGQTHLRLKVSFFETPAAAALLDGTPTFRAALVDVNDTTNVLALLTAPTDTGADYYIFEWASLNRASLITLLGNAESVEAKLVIAWIIDGVTERVVIPVTIQNGYLQDSSTEPDFAPFQVRITSLGFLEIVDTAGNVYNLGLNTGAAPTV
ncbi:hypothetical protein [Prosthecobacter sp.]|uniref:hypothetical protein n=1 Tax=Prosthecobacter sp. TaxID=1965333 RepID=UPI00378342F3